jgi:hypothetical protein
MANCFGLRTARLGAACPHGRPRPHLRPRPHFKKSFLRALGGSPSTINRPCGGCRCPARAPNKVDLPQPDGPRTHMRSPGATANLRSQTASKASTPSPSEIETCADDLRSVRHRLLYTGGLHAAELCRHHCWHAGERPARNGQQLVADDAGILSDAVAASGGCAMNIRITDIDHREFGRREHQDRQRNPRHRGNWPQQLKWRQQQIAGGARPADREAEGCAHHDPCPSERTRLVREQLDAALPILRIDYAYGLAFLGQRGTIPLVGSLPWLPVPAPKALPEEGGPSSPSQSRGRFFIRCAKARRFRAPG